MLLSLLCQFLISTAILLSLLVRYLSVVLGSCSPLYAMTFAMHAEIACLILPLHAGIVCLAFLACDWLFLIGAYQRVSVLSLAMIGGYF